MVSERVRTVDLREVSSSQPRWIRHLLENAHDSEGVSVRVRIGRDSATSCDELRNVSAECALAECQMVAIWRLKRHNGAMPSVQIKDVPEQTHAILRERAAAAHQSLQEYLRSRLIEEASQPSLDEILDRAGGRSGGSVPLKSAVATLRDERARR
jgi:antitoxin FitA